MLLLEQILQDEERMKFDNKLTLYSFRIFIMPDMSISLKVVSIAAVFWASLSR